MKVSRLALGLSLSALAAFAIGSSSAWARPVVQALTGPETSTQVQPSPTPAQASAGPSVPQVPRLEHEPTRAEPSLSSSSDVKAPTPPTPKPAARTPGRLGTSSLDLRDPWGEGSYATAPLAEKPRRTSLDLVDPWDPARSYTAPVAAERAPLLDPWTTPGR